MICEKEEQ